MSLQEDGPSKPKRVNLLRTNRNPKRALTLQELDYELNHSSGEDEPFLSSGSEFQASNSESDSEDEGGVQQQLPLDDGVLGQNNTAQQNPPTASTATDWSDYSQPPNNLKNIIFSKNPELLAPHPGNTPTDFFSLLFDNDFMNFIVEETNKNAVVVLSTSTSEKSRITAWKELTVDELRIFLGLLYHMGTIQLSRIQDYWKTDRLFNLPVFREQVSRNRFLLILRCLHFFS